jgi:hypothetical protein
MPGAAKPTAEGSVKADNSSQAYGPKRAVAEAIAHLLKIQPRIHNTVDFSPQKPVARIVQL